MRAYLSPIKLKNEMGFHSLPINARVRDTVYINIWYIPGWAMIIEYEF
jgi:hypothetical protein